eukprot:13883510-Alexandrium_andersonii.AAC.1
MGFNDADPWSCFAVVSAVAGSGAPAPGVSKAKHSGKGAGAQAEPQLLPDDDDDDDGDPGDGGGNDDDRGELVAVAGDVASWEAERANRGSAVKLLRGTASQRNAQGASQEADAFLDCGELKERRRVELRPPAARLQAATHQFEAAQKEADAANARVAECKKAFAEAEAAVDAAIAVITVDTTKA